MIAYFLSRDLSALGFAATNLPEGLHIVADRKTDELETGTSSFEVTFFCPETEWADAMEMAAPGGLCARVEDGTGKLYQIIETTTDNLAQRVTCYCEDGGLQLLGHRVAKLANKTAHDAEWYIANALFGTAFSVGEVNVTGTKTLSFEESTCVERLVAIAEAFGGELSYTCDIDQIGGAARAAVSLTEKRGKRERQRLYVGEQISRLETRSSAEGAATGILAYGGVPTGYSNPVTLKGFEGWTDITDTDEDGNGNAIDTISLDTQTGILHSAAAADRWGAEITRLFEGTATTKTALLEEALADLRARRDVERTYDIELVSLAPGTEVGDAVAIIDDSRGLYVEARLVTLTRSVTDGSWMATVGEAAMKGSGISARLEALAAKLDTDIGSRKAYIHIAYADSLDGQTGFSRSLITGKSYIGQYMDGNAEGMADPAAYAWQPVAQAASAENSGQLFDYPAAGEVVTGGRSDLGGKIQVLDENSRVVAEWGTDGLEVRDKDGNVIGTWNKEGLLAMHGQEWMRIRESVMTGGYGSDTHGTLDLSAQTGDPPNQTHDVALTANGRMRLAAGTDIAVTAPSVSFSGAVVANPRNGMFQFVQAHCVLDTPVLVAAGAVAVVGVDILDFIPNYYDCVAALWQHASSYQYFIPSAVDFTPGDFTVTCRIWNRDASAQTLGYVDFLLILVRL